MYYRKEEIEKKKTKWNVQNPNTIQKATKINKKRKFMRQTKR
jgi:hypothetical protein